MKAKFSLLFLSIIAFFFTHQLTYSLFFQSDLEKNSYLSETNHHYLTKLPYLLAPIFLLLIFSRYISLAKSKNHISFITIFLTQFLFFITIEHIERVLSGFDAFISIKFYIISFIAQIPISTIIYLILRFIIDPLLVLFSFTFFKYKIYKKSLIPYFYYIYINNFIKFKTSRAPPYL
jgi:hypothetical protein